ncbi:MAG: hypothetical protein M0Q92_03010 [Methanoregula sp.]|jgi:hypothetical protein|nr:hypothetical protein [Methanoregula sp.]
MNVISSRILETCLDGTMNIEITLDRTMDRNSICHLASMGNLEYFSDFPRPFFRITRPGAFIIKGVEGADTFEVFKLAASTDVANEIAAIIRRF